MDYPKMAHARDEAVPRRASRTLRLHVAGVHRVAIVNDVASRTSTEGPGEKRKIACQP